VPPGTENLKEPTLKLLEHYLERGGELLACGEPPARVEGALSERGALLARAPAWQRIAPGSVVAKLSAAPQPDGFAIRRSPDDRGILFHQRRKIADGELLFLVNTSIEHPSTGTVQTGRRGIERWDLDRGTTRAAAFTPMANGSEIAFRLPPSGSLLLFLSPEPLPPGPAEPVGSTTLAATGPMDVRRLGPNVLTLDHIDVTSGGQSRTNAYIYPASQFVFKQNGLERNPWQSAVQFRDTLIKRTFPANSGFEASYRFTIAGPVPADLAIVIESAELYAITCNGQPVAAKPGDWWLDQAFARIALAGAARSGENVVTIKAAPLTMRHELEPAYLLGSFALQPAEKGFVVTPDQPLRAGRWNEQGCPFYAQGVAYRMSFNVASPMGRYAVGLPDWYGSVAKVRVNGRLAGHITAPPWECEVTDHLQPGANTIEVIVIGTLKNTLGPHHAKPPAGAAWPRHFHLAPQGGLPPGREYDTYGYGLFAPFELRALHVPGS
jgi:hypothetical protein